MRQIFNLQLSPDSELYGETENGRMIKLSRATYFNARTGLLYTTKCGYVVVSYAPGQQFIVDEFIQEQLDEVWQMV